MTWLAFIFLLFSLSWAGVGIFRWYAIDKGMMDEPTERSSHTSPTPRGAGIVFFIGWMILLGIFYYYQVINKHLAYCFLPLLGVGLIGFWDDYYESSIKTRLLVQLSAAILSLWLIGEGGETIYPWLSFLPLPLCFIILVLTIVWMINLFNFMDGADGFAASQAIVIFGVGGYFLYQIQAYELAMLACGLVALLAGFLTWNWPGAQVFMGDSGSYFLGFLIVLYALVSDKFFNLPIMLWVILTGLLWFDATITLIRRVLNTKDWYKPHRSHAYQRLIQAGWSHQQVLWSALMVNVVLTSLALIAYHDPRLMTFAFGLAVTFLSCLYIMVEIVRPMFKQWHQV